MNNNQVCLTCWWSGPQLSMGDDDGPCCSSPDLVFPVPEIAKLRALVKELQSNLVTIEQLD